VDAIKEKEVDARFGRLEEMMETALVAGQQNSYPGASPKSPSSEK
jgi:hypothetical protein